MVALGALVRDRDAGEVRVGRDGRPLIRYRLSRYDAGHVRAGIAGAARILEAAGARRIVANHARGIEYRPGHSGHDSFTAALDHFGYAPGALLVHSFHQMGTVRMGASEAEAGCDPEGAVWGVGDLVVCDASTFPTAAGVNPMIAIEAVAHLNASALADRLA
jgi:long-chain-alcohol oxidase